MQGRRLRGTAEPWQPDGRQELLLRAGLLSGDSALGAWSGLRGFLGPEGLDPASRQLLGLAWANLTRLGVSDPVLAGLTRAYARTLARNRQLLDQAERLLAALGAARVEALVLKGLALATAWYRDLGVRPMADVDILVRPDTLAEAARILRTLGWVPLYPLTPSFVRTRHAAVFEDAAGRQCDLHWRIFEESREPGIDGAAWARAIAVDVGRVPARALDATDQLLHVCAHGVKWAPTRSVRWVADAAVVARTSPIEWERLAADAARRGYALRMGPALGYLARALETPVPPEVPAALRARPVSWFERLEHHVYTREHRATGELGYYWCQHLRASGRRPVRAAASFPGYLRDAWGAGSTRALMAGALVRVVRRVWAAAARRPLPERTARPPAER